MAITIADIAREAGVSRATVSGVLNNNPNVAAKTKERIQAIIEKHGYRPNAMARALALQSTGMIGLIVKDISNPLYSKIALGVEEICDDAGYSVVMGNTHKDWEREVEFANLLKNRRVDGLIIFPLQKNTDLHHIQELEAAHLPFVLLADLPGVDADLVRADDESGAFEAAEHLIQQGCKKLAYISGPKEFFASDRRLNGFKKALKKHHIEFNEACVFQSGWRMEDGYNTGLRMVQNTSVQPDGIFCYNDPVAIGLMRALIEHGRRIPQDVAVVGFDDDDISAFVQPGLTTVAQPAQEIGRLATQQLLERIQAKENEGTPERIYLKTNLIVRGSSQRK